jgi:hypothetical protein
MGVEAVLHRREEQRRNGVVVAAVFNTLDLGFNFHRARIIDPLKLGPHHPPTAIDLPDDEELVLVDQLGTYEGTSLGLGQSQ